MCVLTATKPLNAITDSQIAKLTTQEIKQAIQTGSPNYLTLQSMAIELAKRLEELAPTLEVPEAA